MALSNTLSNIQIPNLEEIIKSYKNTKDKLDNLKTNEVKVHFLYSDNRFKNTTKGLLVHIAELPIVFIEYPEKMGFFVLDDALIYDITEGEFNLFVNENFSHSIILSDLKTLDIDKKISKFVDEIKLAIPIFPEQFKLEEIKTTIINKYKKDTKEQIKLLPNILHSLGRAKLLTRTSQVNNDGLIIAAIIGFLLGGIIFLIIGLKLAL